MGWDYQMKGKYALWLSEQRWFSESSPRFKYRILDEQLLRHASKYKINRYDLLELWKQQCRKCAICGQRCEPHIDHDHRTGRVRGILCNQCNLAIGLMKDKPSRLIKAAKYLARTL
jgi:hypothetical protein